MWRCMIPAGRRLLCGRRITRQPVLWKTALDNTETDDFFSRQGGSHPQQPLLWCLHPGVHSGYRYHYRLRHSQCIAVPVRRF